MPTSNYTVIKFPPEIGRRVKAAAAMQGMTMVAWVTSVISEAIDQPPITPDDLEPEIAKVAERLRVQRPRKTLSTRQRKLAL